MNEELKRRAKEFGGTARVEWQAPARVIRDLLTECERLEARLAAQAAEIEALRKQLDLYAAFIAEVVPTNTVVTARLFNPIDAARNKE